MTSSCFALRCPTYNSLPKECFTSTEQGKCCKTVSCVDNGQIVEPSEKFPVVGSFTGGFSGFRPGVDYNPPINGTSGARSKIILFYFHNKVPSRNKDMIKLCISIQITCIVSLSLSQCWHILTTLIYIYLLSHRCCFCHRQVDVDRFTNIHKGYVFWHTSTN